MIKKPRIKISRRLTLALCALIALTAVLLPALKTADGVLLSEALGSSRQSVQNTAPINGEADVADQKIRAELLKPQSETRYFYMDEPYSLSSDESNLYVTTLNRAVYVFTPAGDYVDTLSTDGNAVKAVTVGSATFTLQDGKLTDKSGLALITDVTDVAASLNNLIVLTPNSAAVLPINEGGTADLSASQTYPLPFTPALAAVSSDAVYITCNGGKNSYYSDIYRFNPADGSVTAVYVRTRTISSLAASPLSGGLFALAGDEVICYQNKNGMLKPAISAAVKNAKSISRSSSGVFVLTGEGAILRYDSRLENGIEALASASGNSGFYRSPSNIVTRKSSLLVSDYGNNRIVKVSGEVYENIPFDFIQPTAAAVDNLGKVYAAHDMDKIEVFSSALVHERTLTVEGALIEDLLFDSKNNLYIVGAGKEVYLLLSGANQAQKIFEGRVDALTIAPDNILPYILDNAVKTVYSLSDGKANKIFDFTCDALDFAVDAKKNFYLLSSSGSIYKYSADDGYTEDVSSPTDYENGYTVGAGSDRIILSSVKNQTLDYGDIIVSDSLRHCVRKIDGAAFGVKVIDDSFVPPVIDGDDKPNDIITDPANPDYRIIRTALADADVYEKPLEMSPFYKIAEGRKVIVASYDIEESDAFSFVLIDDLTSSPNRLISGYVYKVLLSEPLPYEPPPAEEGTTYNDRTPVYKWPSRNAQTLKGYNSVEKGASFKLLDFVKEYTDEYPNAVKWYRIDVDGLGEGYIAAGDMSIKNYEPIFERPQTNASIISVEGSTGAPLYDLKDGVYTISEGEQPLLTGTRVEVVGAFDESEKYTLVKYFDARLGTLTGYVETIYLKYDGVSVLTVVIIIIIILTALGITLALVWRYAAKRKQITKA